MGGGFWPILRQRAFALWGACAVELRKQACDGREAVLDFGEGRHAEGQIAVERNRPCVQVACRSTERAS